MSSAAISPPGPVWSLGGDRPGLGLGAGDPRGRASRRRPLGHRRARRRPRGARGLAARRWSRTPEARRPFARPVPRLHAGRWLARHGARAMLDLSDGLGADAAHLAAASGVAVALDLERVPVAASAAAAARPAGVPPEQFAAESGEDYELLVALPADVRGRRRPRLSEHRAGCRSPASARSGAGRGVHATLGGQTGRARRLRPFRAAASLTRSGGAARLRPVSLTRAVMSTIIEVHAREILDSRGNPTVEAEVVLVERRAGPRGRAERRVHRRARGGGAARRRRQALRAARASPRRCAT